jgi:hypothetical protein
MKSNTVNEKMIFESYPLTEELNEYRIKKICLEFPVLNKCNHNFYLSLWKYLSREYNKKGKGGLA